MEPFKNLKQKILIKEDDVYKENISKCNQILKLISDQKTVLDKDETLKKLCIYLQELIYIDHFKYMYRNNKVSSL